MSSALRLVALATAEAKAAEETALGVAIATGRGNTASVSMNNEKNKTGNAGGGKDMNKDDAEILAETTTTATAKNGTNGKRIREEKKTDFIVQDFVWETDTKKKGKFKVLWNEGSMEYSNVKPVLEDKADEALLMMWRGYYNKSEREVAFVEKVARTMFGKPPKQVVSEFKTLKEYGIQRGWVEPQDQIGYLPFHSATYLQLEPTSP
jgi:hypothetical protein